MACQGDQVAIEGSSIASASGYTKTDLSTATKVDVTFTKGATSTEYVYQCVNGQPIRVVTEKPGAG